MFPWVPYFAALIATIIAVPLDSHIFSNSPTDDQCSGARTLSSLGAIVDDDENYSEEPPERIVMKRSKLDSCEIANVQPAVRLSAFPNSGTTWLQYLLEEATKVATQNPVNIALHQKGSTFDPGDAVTCRAECGAQIYLHSACTSGSAAANNVSLSRGRTPEIFKNHYPEFTLRDALFETGNPIQKTILLVRNPVDAFFCGAPTHGCCGCSESRHCAPFKCWAHRYWRFLCQRFQTLYGRLQTNAQFDQGTRH